MNIEYLSPSSINNYHRSAQKATSSININTRDITQVFMAFPVSKNTIRGGGSTMLYAAYTVNTLDAVDTVDIV